MSLSGKSTMNNKTTAVAPLRTSEATSLLTLQILGLIWRTGQGQFECTQKFERLRFAVARTNAGEMLLFDEEVLITECRAIISRY
jgi:hypothetical protein